MAKRTIYDLSNENLGNMTTRQLRSFIKEASARLDKARNSRYKAIAKSYSYIAQVTGTRRFFNKETGKYETRLVLGYDKMTKKQLLARARLLQGHFRIDTYSRNARAYQKRITDEARERFRQRTGFNFSKEEFAEFQMVVASIKDIVEKFGSDNVAKMYEYVNNRPNGPISKMSLGSVIRTVYEHVPAGLEKQDLVEAVFQYLDYMFGED